jgi:hypothetical protein
MKALKFLVIPALAALTFTSCEQKDSSGDASGEDRQKGVDACLKEFYNSMGSSIDMFDREKLDPMAKEYCECSMDKLIEADIPLSKMNSMSEEEITKVAGDCLKEFEEKVMTAIKQ